MAEIVMSAEVENLNDEEAPNGPGYYYSLDGWSSANGPFDSQEEAVAKVKGFLEASAAEFIKQILIPE